MSIENYMFRRERLLHYFDKSLSRVEPLLIAWLGDEASQCVLGESREEYEILMPRIPSIGRNNPLLVFFLPTPQYLAVYRALQRHGLAIEDAGYLAFMIGSEQIKAVQSIARRICGFIWFSQWFKNRLAKRAASSHLRRYRGNYVLDYVEGDGRDFDYGVDYIECASCKFLEAEGAMELAPYVCAVDKTASELLGWGLTRTMTLAEGAHKCDFRFKKGGDTRISLPRSFQARISHGSA